jgi:proteasome beta subunit
MADEVLKTGTTTIGVKYKDGVIMATDQRATMGNIVAHTDVQKLYQIGDNLGMTIAGVVGDAQLMVRYMQSEIAMYTMKKGAPMTVNAAATLVANVIRQGFYLGLIVGGYDRTGGHIFSIDGAGGYIEDNIMSVGSGSVFALGALEAGYKADMSEDEARDLVITALHSAMSRDSASGDGMLIAIIDKDGFRWIPQEDIKARTAEIGFNYPVR